MEYKRNDQSVLQDYLDEWQQYADAGGCEHSIVGVSPQCAFRVNTRPAGNYIDKDFLYHNRTWGPIVLEDYLYSLYGSKPIK